MRLDISSWVGTVEGGSKVIIEYYVFRRDERTTITR